MKQNEWVRISIESMSSPPCFAGASLKPNLPIHERKRILGSPPCFAGASLKHVRRWSFQLRPRRSPPCFAGASLKRRYVCWVIHVASSRNIA